MHRKITQWSCSVIAVVGSVSSYSIGIYSYFNNSDVSASLAYLCLGLFGSSLVIWLTYLISNDMQDLTEKIKEFEEK